MKTQMIEVSVIAALVGLGILVYYIYRKSKRKEQPEVQDVEWRIRTANRRADAAGERATEWRILAAQRRAAAAGERARASAIGGARQKFNEIFVQHATASGTLWYFLVSVIGVNYSWGFYQPFDIYVFDFFNTPDFLLSAFQNIAMLITGILLTLVGIGIFVSLTYSSIRDSASDFTGQPRVRREALILVSITLVSIVLVSVFVLFFAWWNWTATSSNLVLCGIIFVIFILTLVLVVLAYRFIKLASNPIRNADQVRRDERILLFIILIEATFIIPFLWGGVDSYAAREDAFRSVKVTLSQDSPKTSLPDRTLFLGTTSNFHIFYECENALIDKNGEVLKNTDGTSKKCEKKNGRPFVIPTTNIASLKFKPQNTNEGGGKPPVGLSHVVGAISAINKNNKKNTRKITKEIKNLHQAIVANPDIANAINALNQTIGKLNPTVVPSPLGLDKIAKAIEGLDPKVTINLEPDGIIDAIKDNTTEITAAIKEINLSCGRQDQGQNHCPHGPGEVMIISSFPEEDHEISGIGEGVQNLIEYMRIRFAEDQTLQQLILIGLANEQHQWKAGHYYNLNDSSLAKARTKWVLDELKARFPDQKEKIEQATILLLSVESQHSDIVAVLACMSPKPGPKPQPASSSAASTD